MSREEEPTKKKHCAFGGRDKWFIPAELESEINFKCPFGTYIICQTCLMHDPDSGGGEVAKIKARGNFWYGNFTDNLKNSRHHKENVMRKQNYLKKKEDDPSYQEKKTAIHHFSRGGDHQGNQSHGTEQGITQSNEEPSDKEHTYTRLKPIPLSTKVCRGLLVSQDLHDSVIQQGLQMILQYYAPHIIGNDKVVVKSLEDCSRKTPVISIFGKDCEGEKDLK